MKDFLKYFKQIILTITAAIVLVLASFSPIFAEELPEKSDPLSLYFYAVNVGYKDDNSPQNYDFFELEKSSDDELPLGDFEIVYTNSSNNEAGRFTFLESEILTTKSLVFGFAKSPQYEASDGKYLYTFSSSGLASTAGKLSIYQSGELIDEVCWGKILCEKALPKFSTSEEDNYSARLVDGEFIQDKYYPEIISDAIYEEQAEATISSCHDLEFTELYSFYEASASEQFIEIRNKSNETNDISGCFLRYKNKNYALGGIILPSAYFVYYNEDLILTKNPISSNLIEIVDSDGALVDSLEYPHGQKVGLSFAKIGDGWKLSYNRTPGAENIYQEYQSCPEGKEINPDTGNCVNVEEETETTCPEGKYLNPETGRCKNVEATTVKTCAEGYYLNPETNRCKKEEAEATLAECADGYERNPETNRCRKIQSTDASEYAPATSASKESYSAPKRFIAYGVVIIALAVGLGYVVFQYREELLKLIKKLLAIIQRSAPIALLSKETRDRYGL